MSSLALEPAGGTAWRPAQVVGDADAKVQPSGSVKSPTSLSGSKSSARLGAAVAPTALEGNAGIELQHVVQT
ncbi:hypothetical protein [Kribbella kalugense]|uniref:Uncharacterized protein n=1 Tax=Kribbella kalugense TaxID=2512221 RepID=A0A4V3G8U3_9ACTN|nr:hypothetical protein [Kribbella kalugense]TDW24244.1 hypothetical protein EV650_3116 [Kribbella kalugense]